MQAGTEFSRVKSLTATVTDTETVFVDWKAVTGAKQYKVRLLRGNKLIKTKTVTKSKANLTADLFKNNRSYTVKVRVLDTKKKTASDWQSETFTYNTVAQPPTLTEVQAPTTLPGGATWLFFVDDGQDQLAVSTESGQPFDSDGYDWETVATSADTVVRHRGSLLSMRMGIIDCVLHDW